MGNMSIGIALFVLIIIVGLIIGLRLSSTSLQRRAVAVSFVLMALVAAAFWAVAMGASQVWTAPFFAIACIVVPVAAYSAIMKASKSSRPEPKRREDSRPRQAKTGSALEAAVMPVAPNHPVNEFRDLHSGSETTDGEERRDEIASAAEPVEEKAPAAAPVAEDAEAVSAESAGAAEESGTAPKADEPQERAERAEAFIDEYLIEQNEGEDGMFEPEMTPSLQPRTEAPHTTSTMMMTVPFPEGDEQYLVVSDTTSVPNPILAYKRTTSSHLVPLGASRRGIHAKPSAEAEEASVQDRQTAAPAVEPRAAAPLPQVEEPVELEEPALGEPPANVDFAAIFREAPKDDGGPVAPQLELDFTPRPESPFKPAFRPVAKHAPAASAPAARTSAPVPPTEGRSAAEPRRAAAVAAEPRRDEEAAAPSRPTMEPRPERRIVESGICPAVEPRRVEEAPAQRPVDEPRLAAFRSEPEPRPAAAPAATGQRAPIEERPAAVPAASVAAAEAPAPAPTAVAVEPVAPAPAPAPAAPASDPATAPAPAAEPATAPAAASTRDARYNEFIAKAQGLRDKGLFPVAARLYGEAAAAASSTSEARRARFEEMACYVKAGQGDRARALAAELRNASVLTRIERIKLDAVERMG
ncbi:hypothetical protein [Adlercreutzia muris]|uniref:hypothetical protein n=1 Tax=Adlercreutzia muris TaxID=1796610 RepID=UPI001F579529|nr:hypothetical protein [Adlercreutzia muris]